MIQAMLPFLQASQRPRIVNVASTTASLALAGDPNSMFSREDTILAYASSKAAVSMLDDLTSHSEVVHCALCRHWNGATVKIRTDTTVALILRVREGLNHG
jgi:hypothetical protein